MAPGTSPRCASATVCCNSANFAVMVWRSAVRPLVAWRAGLKPVKQTRHHTLGVLHRLEIGRIACQQIAALRRLAILRGEQHVRRRVALHAGCLRDRERCRVALRLPNRGARDAYQQDHGGDDGDEPTPVQRACLGLAPGCGRREVIRIWNMQHDRLSPGPDAPSAATCGRGRRPLHEAVISDLVRMLNKRNGNRLDNPSRRNTS